jgi:hypothetical protein
MKYLFFDSKPIIFLLTAICPIILGFFTTIFGASSLLIWITQFFALVFLTLWLYRNFNFDSKARLSFILYYFVSLILTLSLSYIFFLKENILFLFQITDFWFVPNPKTDINANINIARHYYEYLNTSNSIFSVLNFHWKDHYSNLVIPYKIMASLIAFPKIGLFSIAILGWWLNVVFFSLVLWYCKQIKNSNDIYYIALLLTFLIFPFCLPNDRESVIALPIFFYMHYCLKKISLKIGDWLILIISLLLIYYHRNVYEILAVILLIIILLCKSKLSDFKKKYVNIFNFNYLLICTIFAAYFAYKYLFFKSLLSLDVQNYLNLQMFAEQDNWNEYYTNIFCIDFFVKYFFILLTPFPFINFTKEGNHFIFNLADPLSMNIIPIYFFSKFSFIYLKFKTNNNLLIKPSLPFFLYFLFLLPLIIGPRAGGLYALPAYIFLIFDLLSCNKNIFITTKNFLHSIMLLLLFNFIYIFFINK